MEAFQATFEEARASDLLLHVIDLQSPDQLPIVESVLAELGLSRHPVIRVFNKIDRDSGRHPNGVEPRSDDRMISALRGDGLAELLEQIDRKLAASYRRTTLLVPHRHGADLATLYATGRILRREDRRDGVFIEAELEEKYFHKFKKFHTNS